jgi:glycerol kinase
MKKYVLAIDQGTTSSRVVLVDRFGDVKHIEQMTIGQSFPFDGAVLQNAEEIYDSVVLLIDRMFKRHDVDPKDIIAMGITNQRETTILFDKTTGKSLYHAISWQSRQTEEITNKWIKKGYDDIVLRKTGLKINPYFSASKIRYILDRINADVENVRFGTVDTYLLYRLTNNKVHKTDVTNASRTMIFNIETLIWDEELLQMFNIPKSILPEVCANDELYGYYNYNGIDIPIYGMIGDQQSALFGHQCFEPGEAKVTYGTGCFMLMNTGADIYYSDNGLISTIGWRMKNKTTYALEGSVFMGGAAVKWIRDRLGIIKNASETEKLAASSNDDTLYVVPAFVGLGAPYWDNQVRGSILGLKSHTTKADIAKATLNSIAYQVNDLLEVMDKDAEVNIQSISVDGGASENRYLMQFQSSISQVKLIQTAESEVTALGAAYLAGLASGYWNSFEELKKNRKIKQIFHPLLSKDEAKKRYEKWLLAVKATQSFR